MNIMNIKRIWPPALLIFLIITVATVYSIDKHSAPSPTLIYNESWIKGVSIVGDPGTLQIGTQYSIIWDSSKEVKIVTIALEKDGQYVKNLIWNLENNGGAVWTPDRSLQPGENYQIVMSDRTTDWGKPVVYRSKNFTIEDYPCLGG